ncbi:MAG: outer membrane lipoprotein chaperone LolA [Gammaproteobacteria bacterium]
MSFAPLRRAWSVLAITVSCAFGASANNDSSAGIIAYLNGLDSFVADFTQTRLDEDGELLDTAQGRCHIKRPGRFRWVYREPYPQLIVSDGDTLWIYDQDLEQITRTAVDEAGHGSPAALLGRETDIARHYQVTALESRDGQDWFRLESREAASDFEAIELAFAEGEVRAMRLVDNLGQETVLTFSSIVRNGPVEDALFEFTPPPGVDVIEGAMP